MPSDTASTKGLPEAVEARLGELCRELAAAIGDRLVSIGLHGPAARGEYAPGRTDIDLLLVVSDAAPATLDAAAPIVRRATRDLPLAVMVLTPEDLKRSCDVFPVKFLAIKQDYRVLHGSNAVADLAIAHDHLRLRCEQEVKNLLLRLRRFHLLWGRNSDLVDRTLQRAASTLRANLRAARNLDPALADLESESAVAEHLGLETEPLRRIDAIRRGELAPDPEILRSVFQSFLALVEEAAERFDRWEERRS